MISNCPQNWESIVLNNHTDYYLETAISLILPAWGDSMVKAMLVWGPLSDMGLLHSPNCSAIGPDFLRFDISLGERSSDSGLPVRLRF